MVTASRIMAAWKASDGAAALVGPNQRTKQRAAFLGGTLRAMGNFATNVYGPAAVTNHPIIASTRTPPILPFLRATIKVGKTPCFRFQ